MRSSVPAAASFAARIPSIAVRVAVVAMLLVAHVATATAADANAPAPVGSDAARVAADRLDWVEYESLPAAIARALPTYCAGAYVEPSYPAPRGSDPGTFPLEASAATVEYWLGDRAELTGGVRVAQGNRFLAMDRATYREAAGAVEVEGDLVLREPGLLILGERAELELESGAAHIDGTHFVLHESRMRGSAASVARDDAGSLRIDRGRFTRCEPGNDSWSLASRRIDIADEADFGSARHAVLRVGALPVFYAPYIRFPVTDERLSGFLFPDLYYDDDDGFDVALPYYFNLAPNYDATLTPRWIEERGAGAEIELRHLSRHGTTELGGAYLSDDDQYDGTLSRDDFEELGIAGDFEPADRWLVSVDHRGAFGSFGTFVDFADVSDDDYFRDLGTDLAVASQIQLEQRGEIRYGLGGLQMRLWAQDFVVLDDETIEPYRRLPELALSYQDARLGPFTASVDAAIAEFDRANDAFVGIDRINGRRLHAEPRLQLPLRWPFGFLRLTGGFRYTEYDLEDEPAGTDADPSREIWFGSADTGVVFERETRWLGAAALQTLEPRLYYLYQQKDEQADLPLFDTSDLTFGYSQLFRDNRFSGLDRIGDANQLSAGVTTRFLDTATGRERARASLGQILYFEHRDVTLRDVITQEERHSSSAFAGEGVAALGRSWSAESNFVWDPHDDEWTEIGAYLRYRGSPRHLFNVGYRQLDDYGQLLRQGDASFYWPVLKRFALFGRWYYDFETNEEVELFGGLEYNDCCWQVRILGRKYLTTPATGLVENAQSDSGVFIQVVFKGLAGIGGRIDSLLENGILGFVPEEP